MLQTQFPFCEAQATGTQYSTRSLSSSNYDSAHLPVSTPVHYTESLTTFTPIPFVHPHHTDILVQNLVLARFQMIGFQHMSSPCYSMLSLRHLYSWPLKYSCTWLYSCISQSKNLSCVKVSRNRKRKIHSSYFGASFTAVTQIFLSNFDFIFSSHWQEFEGWYSEVFLLHSQSKHWFFYPITKQCFWVHRMT